MKIVTIFVAIVAATILVVTSATLDQASGSAVSEQEVVNATIVKGAATLKDKAFDPNPVNITVGQEIEWTNTDKQKHTITSGTGPDDPNAGKEFGSDKLATGETFSYDFLVAEEVPYFCEIHPRMTGKIIVSG